VIVGFVVLVGVGSAWWLWHQPVLGAVIVGTLGTELLVFLQADRC